MVKKQIVINRFFDPNKLNFKNVNGICFNKFLSARLLRWASKEYPSVKCIYLPRSALKKCSKIVFKEAKKLGFEIFVVKRSIDRPSTMVCLLDLQSISENVSKSRGDGI